jgi:hypothetical protein
MKTPDITPAQIAAYLTAIVTAGVVLFKLDLTDAQQAALVAGISAAVALGFPLADAIIRHGRSRQLAPPPAAPVVNVAAPAPAELSELAPAVYAMPTGATYPDSAMPGDTAGAAEAQMHAADQAAAGVPRHDAEGQPYGDTAPTEPGEELSADTEAIDGV